MNNIHKNTLNKKLKLFDVFCIASGPMVSSGLFVLSGIAHAQAGPAVIFSEPISQNEPSGDFFHDFDKHEQT